MNGWVELRIPALSQNESFARMVVAFFALQAGDWSVAELNEIKTAVSEAVTNAIIHAYEDNLDTGDIVVQGQATPGTLEVTITDFGRGIADIVRAREPLFTTKAHEERSGLGFTVMENFMDELTVTSSPRQGTSIRMVKYLNLTTVQ
ncbi:MAG: Anti-sigma F factor [Firmicutes bacterium]|nr:Anti-sigma F factor [candidate division NPL-UPA2 bacterium]